jgi:biopolymer transport protein ExbD
LPRAENPSLASMGETIVVTIMADGTFFVGEEKVAKADLRGKLKAAKKVSGIIMVRGDKTADFQDIMRVVDIAKDLGIEKIVFMTEKKSLPFTDSGE